MKKKPDLIQFIISIAIIAALGLVNPGIIIAIGVIMGIAALLTVGVLAISIIRTVIKRVNKS